MVEPNADLTPKGQCDADRHLDAARHRSTPLSAAHHDADADLTPGQPLPAANLHDADETPRSELLSAVATEPSYFSPQPRRLYPNPITRSTPVSPSSSARPSPTSSLNHSITAFNDPETPSTDRFGPSLATQHPGRPAYQRDISGLSTASSATVRADYALNASTQRQDGPVYPNQSYAALQFQQYPSPHLPPVVRSRSSHPSHAVNNSVSGLPTLGFSGGHYRDIMESAPRTAGNSPISSPGLFDPSRRHLRSSTQPNDGLYSGPWLHHTHRQAPKESHVADVTLDPVSGRKLVNQYEIIDELGRGVHGKVKLGKDLEGEKFVAIKIVDRYSKRRRLGKNTSHEDKIKREIAILKKARHPNIVSLLEVIDDPAKKKVYIVLEHVELGEVKWRTEGAKEICLVEWRRFKRESEGIFDNDRAAQDDERIIRLAHQKLARQQRRKAREAQLRRQNPTGHEPWSFEFGGDSEDDDGYSEAGRSSRASTRDERPSSRVQFHEWQEPAAHDGNMETAFRSSKNSSTSKEDELINELDGTMYGAYVPDAVRGRTPSVAGSASSHLTDFEDELPEHFRYVPLMTIQAAWEAFKDTVLGIEYLHYQNVIHRDIKPANLLVTREHRIKISDFGVSYLGRQKTEDSNGDLSETDLQEVDEAIELAKTVGTPAFYAPELCRTGIDVDTPRIDGGIDVWALGVTLYCLIYGRVPFHDANTFALMKVISEEEPYIPRYRLKPVSEHTTSRPNSHGRNMQTLANSKRAFHDLEYEEVDESLRDLLRQLLIKDSRHRITIPEIKRHPWLLQGISNYTSWMEETDPSRSFQGRKIEISNDDLEQAVVPITFAQRVKSVVKKGTEFMFGTRTSRRRAQSSAQDVPLPFSTASSSSTISQDASRRPSLAPTLLEMLSRSRESEHPLSHSVTASPEARERSRFFDSPVSRTASPAQQLEGQRPQLQDRSYSSAYTVRPADASHSRAASPRIPPALPGTPTALDTPGGSNLSGLFGGLPRRVVNSMRSKDKLNMSREHARVKSIDKLVSGDDDAHGAPSLAISTTNAAGHVDQPDLKEYSPIAHSQSPSYSDAHSFDAHDTSSRQSSVSSSLSSRLHQTWVSASELEVGPTIDILPGSWKSQTMSVRSSHPSEVSNKSAYETSSEMFDRAKDEFRRRRIREETMERERPTSSSDQRPTSSRSQAACPPSPDDETFFQRQKVEHYLTQHDQSSDNSPVGGQERGLAFCSSEEQFTPMSQSTSHPSIPSVASAGSSAPDECAPLDRFASIMPTASADSINTSQSDAPIEDLAGYDPDHPIDSDEDDESDDDAGLFIGKRKPKIEPKPRRSNSISNAELARSNFGKEIGHNRRRSARSGSNGTVKKIPPPGQTSAEHTPEAE